MAEDVWWDEHASPCLHGQKKRNANGRLRGFEMATIREKRTYLDQLLHLHNCACSIVPIVSLSLSQDAWGEE